MESDKRLSAILDEIDSCDTLADVGCDHGLTCLFALKYGKANSVIACDISAPSLKKAQVLLSESGYENVSDFRVGDGLSVIRDNEADTVVISGMGGREILSIMQDSFRHNSTFILSPQSEVQEVRTWLVENGYHIFTDKIVESHDKFYPIIKTSKGKDSYTEIQYKYGRDNLRDLSEDFIKWADYEIERARRIIKTTDSESTREKFWEYVKELEEFKNKR